MLSGVETHDISFKYIRSMTASKIGNLIYQLCRFLLSNETGCLHRIDQYFQFRNRETTIFYIGQRFSSIIRSSSSSIGLLMFVFSCNHRVIRELDTFSFLAIHEWVRSICRSHSGSHFRKRLFCSMSTIFDIVDLLPALNDLFSVAVKEWGKCCLAPVYGIMGR